MDEFGVLVESIGFRAHGKSAPMAKLKPKPKSHFTTHNTSSFHDPSSLPIDELDGIFRSTVNISKTRQSQNAFVVDDDIFGGPVSSSNQFGGVDLESVFSAGPNAYGDSQGSKSKQRDPVDDLFGSFGLNASGNQAKKVAGFDDLISGFGGASQPKNRVYSEAKSNGRPSNSSSTGIDDDPFSVFEPSVSQSDASWPFNEPSFDQSNVKKSSVQSNGFGNFVMAGPPKSGSKVGVRPSTVNKPSPRTSSNGFENADYMDAIFGGSNAGKRNNNAARPSSTAQNSLFDGFFHEEDRNVKQTSSQSLFSTKKASSPPSIGNDFTSLFGDVTSSSGEFHEIEGEPAERRRARLKRYMEMNKRMAEALAIKNQRDLQIQHEQDEKRRLADTLDSDIKRWAAGKEGNLRALLSSLQQVLGPESGWRAVPLTDMITSESVRKVYKKATLCVHPDKVQQRGANLHQKYVAEKVFDILKEASNKFNAEELR
ncbi:auxilin-related protein 2 [Phtheirospermum japonicum]|uniref:Auxilin-related protein 2 n=1 Tax=Phtheirospermum japonicum TaxID=374723 RepID=A0A830BBA5_9LAMI|nr:auxilin-related protein 2 [Phtheirospermum japonicum]